MPNGKKGQSSLKKEQGDAKAHARATMKSSPNSHSNARATKVVGGKVKK